MPKTQKYGIAFPITIQSDDKTLVDLNPTPLHRVRSELRHVIFTPKGQRLRSPNFGSSLIRFIFSPQVSETWGDVISEIKDIVRSQVVGCNVEDVTLTETESGLGIKVRIDYTVDYGNGIISDSIEEAL